MPVVVPGGLFGASSMPQYATSAVPTMHMQPGMGNFVYSQPQQPIVVPQDPVDMKLTTQSVPVFKLPSSRLSQAVEWIDQSMDAIATSALDQSAYATLLWIMTKVKPDLKITVFRVETYRQLYDLFKNANTRLKDKDPVAYQMTMVRLADLSQANIGSVAADLGFNSEWLVSKKTKSSS